MDDIDNVIGYITLFIGASIFSSIVFVIMIIFTMLLDVEIITGGITSGMLSLLFFAWFIHKGFQGINARNLCR